MMKEIPEEKPVEKPKSGTRRAVEKMKSQGDIIDSHRSTSRSRGKKRGSRDSAKVKKSGKFKKPLKLDDKPGPLPLSELHSSPNTQS